LKLHYIWTHYRLGGLGIKSWWGEILHTHPDRPSDPPCLPYNECWVSFSRVQQAGHVHHPPHLVPRSKIKSSYTSTPPLGLYGLFSRELTLLFAIRYTAYLPGHFQLGLG
jgi:hypothetical protein